jgi:hypothetical protein
MQLAIDHSTPSVDSEDLRFFVAAGNEEESREAGHHHYHGKAADAGEACEAAGGRSGRAGKAAKTRKAPEAAAETDPPFTLVIKDPAEAEDEENEQEDFADLFDEERRRSELLEQKLASAMLLLHETAAERDRWHSQAQRALAMIDSLQRQLTTRPMRQAPPRRRFLGLF